MKEVLLRFGLAHSGNYATLHARCQHDGIDLSALFDRAKASQMNHIATHGFQQQYSLPDILVENSSYGNRGQLKKRLLREGLLDSVCSECGCRPVWKSKPLVLVLDHINGVRNDNRIENLRLLCPNCNSQTDTFAGRKIVFCNNCNVRLKQSTPSGLCKSCSARKNVVLMHRKSKCPSKEKLIELRTAMGREEVGRMFGVSGNAVKKWEVAHEIIGTLPDGRTL